MWIIEWVFFGGSESFQSCLFIMIHSRGWGFREERCGRRFSFVQILTITWTKWNKPGFVNPSVPLEPGTWSLHHKHMGIVFIFRNRIFWLNIWPSLSSILPILIETRAQAIVHIFLYCNHSVLVCRSLAGMVGILNGKAMAHLKEAASLHYSQFCHMSLNFQVLKYKPRFWIFILKYPNL